MSLPGVAPLFPQKPVLNPVAPQQMSLPVFGKHEIQQVKGFEGANAVPMGPNCSDIFPDQDLPVVWVVMTDQNGTKTMVKGYKLGEEYVPPKPVTMEDLMAEIKTMNERLMRVEEHNESDRQRCVEDGIGDTNRASISTSTDIGDWTTQPNVHVSSK